MIAFLILGLKNTNGINMFNNKTIMITGGTGSFGKHFINYILKKYKTKKIMIK